jgi:hypothetical protein
MKLDVTIEADDEVTPWLARVARDIEGGKNVNGVNGFISREMAKGVRDHLVRIAPSRHKTAMRLGAAPTGHLTDGAQAVSARPSDEGVVIDLPIPGIRRAFQDVTIVPVMSKWLTIAATGEAYGRRARSFADLRFIPFRENLAALARKGPDGEMDVMFWLKKSVFQRQDRTLLPSDEELLQMAEDGAEAFIDYQESLPINLS